MRLRTLMCSSLVRCVVILIKDRWQCFPVSFVYRFTDEFFQSPERGYGASVSSVFIKLRNDKLQDVYGPAQQQFNGMCAIG